MIPADDANHGRFEVERVVFDNGEFSVVWGNYKDEHTNKPKPSLGMRWNGYDDVQTKGFPTVNGKPVWFVVPPYLEVPILTALRCHVEANLANVVVALREAAQKSEKDQMSMRA